jgi:hypothetical protein
MKTNDYKLGETQNPYSKARASVAALKRQRRYLVRDIQLIDAQLARHARAQRQARAASRRVPR